ARRRPQILILLSGGRSQDDVGGAAAALKQDKIVPFSIGTRNADILELQMIAHIPSYALSVPRFDDLESIQQQLLSFVKRVPRQPRVYQPTVVDKSESKQRDVVFLLDGSDETLNGFEAMRDFVQRVVEKLAVEENKDQVSVVQYSREPEAHFYLNTYTTKEDVVDSVRGLRHKGGRPLNTGAALQYVRDNVFTASSGSRRQEGIPQILVLLSGGRSNDDVRNAVTNLKEIGVMAIVVGMRNADTLELQTISHEPSYAFSATHYNDLPNIQQQVLSAVERVELTTTNLPTTLIDAATNDYRRDIVFLLDGSDDSRRKFPDIQDFIQRVVEKLNVDGKKDHVSVVQYSDTAEVNFKLGMHSKKDDVLDAVRGLRHKGGSPLNTGAALQYVRGNVFTASNGSRSLQGVQQILILLSGGRSRDDIRTPVTKLKEMGVISIGIGTGDADTLELQTISHEPNYALSITDFKDLPTIQEELLSLLTEASRQPVPTAHTMHFESDKKDVVFLIDGSDDSRTGFAGIRRFAEKVVESLNVEENGDRVALVQYSRDATPNFYLNSYSSKNDVLNSIRSMRHKVGRILNTGTALQFVRDTVFPASAGGRRAEGVPQYLFVFSGGRSSNDLRGPAQSLRGDGVRTFSFGTKNADTLELQSISFTPAHSFSVANFNNLDGIHSSVAAVMSGVKETPEISTVIDNSTLLTSDIQMVDGVDVVFLLDGSDKMRESVQSIRDFLGQFVKHLEIGPDKTHVAVIQYSDKPTTHFLLNTYSSKSDIMAKVRNINLEGGRPLNTGEALDYVKNNVFTVSSGSRLQEGIPQILILLSGGKSQDDVVVPSESLKAAGIVLLTVGVKDADGAEMQSIAYSPNQAYLLREFSDLSLVRQQLLSAIVSHKDSARPGLVQGPSVKRDIVFLLDGSDDVRSRFTAIREFVAKVVEKFDVDQGKDQVAVVQYSNSAAVNFNLNAYKTRDDVLTAVRNLKPKGGRPQYTGTALQFVKDNVFTTNAGSRRHEGAQQILVLLTGGRSRDSPRGPSRALKTFGVVTFAIGSRMTDLVEMQSISSLPNYSYSVPDFANLQNIQKSLETHLAQVRPQEETRVAENDENRRDIVFLLDGSDNTRKEYPAIRDFLHKIIENLNVEQNNDRVAVVQFSNLAVANFYLNSFLRKEDMLNSVRGLSHKGGRPLNTGAALKFVKENVFISSSGSRHSEGVKQILILISSGRSRDNVDTPAYALKELGVLVIGIGTRSSDSKELQKISHDPSYALSVSEFTDLPNVQQQLLSAMRTVIVQVTTMTPTVIPTILVESQAPRRDVVFLLDGSDGTRSGFPAMRDFVQRVVETLGVDENKDRVAVVQYSRDPAAQFYLNTYTTKGEILNTVRGLRHKGGRPLNTGAALQYVRDNVFTASSGSRRFEGVPQLLILLSGGRSFDNVDTPASALKELGVLIFGIGTRSSDSRELQRISHDPSYALSVSDFTDLPNIQQQLLSSVEAVVIDVTPESPTVLVDHDTSRKDVVFLVDGSDGARNGFPAMRDFVQRVVGKLNVGGDKDRVSVVQYGRDQEVHFYLNTYTTKEDILDTVRSLRHRGGRPLNTGAALQYVRDNVFTASSGSRSQEGVPQMLILLSGGRSSDNVDIPASALKKSGVLIFGIGTRNSSREVQRIATDPSFSQSVSEFTDLPSIQEQFFSTLITVKVEATPITPTVIVDQSIARKDVVFLLDGSDGTKNGFPAMRDFVQRVVEKLTVEENRDRELGVLVFGIGTRSSDSRELQKISYDPSYALSVSEFTDLPNVQQQLLSAISTVIVQVTTMTPTVIPTILVESQAPRRDVVFLLDGSDGTRSGFPAMRDFVQRVVETLGVDENKDRVAVVQYSRDPAAQFYLNTYTTKGEILNTVRGLRHKGGRPLNTGAALQYVRDNVFTASSGSRRFEGVPQLLILLSGGRSFDNVDTPASALKELGVLIFGIGTRSSDSRELQRISHDPSYALSVSDFTDLPNIQQQLLSSVEAVVIDVTPESPTVLVDHDTSRKDVVFLVDGSDGARNGFPAMRDFVQRVVGKLNVGGDKDRVSVVQYGRDQEVHFYLNTYTTKEDILDTVRSLRHRGGRPLNTGAALQYVRDNVFTASSGSRSQEGVPQMLILLSGGRSSDNVDIPASALKKSGVLIFGIGTRNSSREVERIATDPSFSQSVSEFTDLPSVQEQFFSTLITVQVEATPITPTVIVDQSIARKDVVFLLDGSDGTKNGFPAMRDFVQRVVEKLTVEENRDRELGVLVFGIGTRSSDSRELQKISYDPSYALSVSEFTDLPNVQQQLLSAISTVIVQVTTMTPTVIPTILVESQAPRRDVVFLLDGSDGTRSGFPAMRDFVQRVVETLGVDENKDRVAVVQYSRDPAAQFYLNTYTTKGEILNTVRGLRHKGGRPLNTGAALQYVRDNVFTASSGSRRFEGVPQLLILLSGGRSFDNVDTPASALKELGVLIFGIGTRSSDSRELQRISHDPSYALSVSDFTDLPNIQQQLLSSVEAVVIDVTPESPTSVSEFTDLPSIQEQFFSTLITVQVEATPITPTVIVDQSIARKDVVFLLDGSDGTKNGFPAMRDFVQRVVEKLTVEENRDRVSVVQYSRESEAHFYLNTHTTKEDVVETVRGLRHKGGRPLNTGAALQYVRDNVFTASSGSRRLEGVPQILILLNGGRSFDNVDTPASALKELGVLVFGIGTRSSDSKELQKISYDPSYALSVSEFTDLPNVQQQLLSAISTVIVQVTTMTPTVIPTILVESQAPRRDVVFLLDGSDGTRSGFPAMRDFVQRVVETLGVDENKDRVAVVQYSRDPAAQFYLNTYTTKGEILNTVRGLRHKGGRPLNTGAALQYVRDNVFTASSGSRRFEGVPQLLILLSGGRSFDNVDTPASALKELGVLIFGIGTRSSDSRELQRISHDPSYALSVSDFTDLPNIQQQLLSSVEAVVIDVTPESPTVLVDHDTSRKDVVFLVDGSDGARNGFPAMRDFVQRVVGKLNVGGDKDRVSVVQYGRDQEVHFYLNTYTTKEDILDTVRSLRHRGGRPLNTGAALQYVRDNVFTASSGSRSQEGVPQMLILLSGGRSSDNVDIPASALKKSGVLIFGIGTRNSSRESVSEFTDLPSIQEQFFSTLITVQVEATPITPTVIVDQSIARKDVVFLLDGSDGTKNGFPAMRDFVQRVVEKLTVEENRDRVSVVQYSRESEAHFYLNTHTTKEDVVETVRGLRHKGGRPLNTGAALQYVRDNVFTASSGSRRLEGVPQILILLNGGRSFDNVDTPASALKELGVFVFGIGTRSSDSRELQKISYDPSYALSVSEFTDLPNVQQQLLSAISTVIVQVTTMTPTVIPTILVESQAPRRDVVFLLDGSDGTRSGFPAMRDFVQRVVETLGVDENKDRVAVVQYSRDPAAQFYLNTYTTKGEILNTVRGLRHKGGRPLNTGAALQYVRDNVFTASSGSRRFEGVPQLLILLSGGRSFDNVDTPASALKELGVLIFGIGTRSSDSRELQRISHDPSYALSVSDFTDLPNIQQQLLSSVEAVVIDVTPESPTVLVDHDTSRKDVVFLVDGSDGARNGFPAMRDFVQSVVGKLNVGGDKDRVSVVQYGRDQEVHFYLNTYSTKEDILDGIRLLRHKGGGPLNTGAALQFVREKVFRHTSGSRRDEGVPQILILLSGGRSNDAVRQAALDMKGQGIQSIGIAIRQADTREMQSITSDPQLILGAQDFSDLPGLQLELLSSISQVSSPGLIGPRHKGGTLLNTGAALLYIKDNVFTASAGSRHLLSVTQVLVILSGGRSRYSINNASHALKQQGIMVFAIGHKGGRSRNTATALQYVRDNVLTNFSGSRHLEGIPQVLILLTGGPSSDNARQSASTLKDLGILSFSIVIDSIVLPTTAHKTSFGFLITDFGELPDILLDVLFTLKRTTLIGKLVKAGYPDPATFIGQGVESQGPKKDIVFLVDGSDGVGREFPIIQEFIRRIVENLNVGKNKIRIGVVQYGGSPNADIYLNSHTTKEGIMNAVKGLRQRGGRDRNLGQALEFVSNEVLNAQHGGRKEEGVPQFLIVVSGGKSTDDISRPATSLKQSGVFPFSIGTRDVNPQELQVVSYVPNFAYTVDDFPGLYTVQETLISTLTELSDEDIARLRPVFPTVDVTTTIVSTGGEKRDVVFLIDGTTAVRSEFPAIRDMIGRVVEKLDVGLDRVRVSVVQYSDDASTAFLLNEHSTKDEVRQATRKLRSKGGNRLNTGRALEWVSKNIFQKSAGSRIAEGVPQFLILVTGGKSNDDVSGPANQLKTNLVVPLAIGAKNADPNELRQIALKPELAYSINNFGQLPTVEQQLIASVNTMTTTHISGSFVPPVLDIANLKMGRKDIIFLIDGSDTTGSSGIAHIRDFILNIVQQLDVQPDQVQVAVVQYSDKVKTEFSLNSHNNKPAVLSAIKRLRQQGGRSSNLAEAIEYVIRNELKSSAGVRLAEASQHLVVLTGGRSPTDVSVYGPLLKGSRVNCIGIGAGGADSRQLNQIATSSADVLQVPTFPGLPVIKERFIARLNGTIPEEAPTDFVDPSLPKAKVADIVFLVDGSINLGKDNFKEVMDFILNLVDLFFTERDNLQIGLAHYTTDVTDVFYLNTYKDKDDIISAISRTEYKGGRRINTGAAIHHVQENHFIKEKGSRKDKGIPQILMIVTGGRSSDDSKTAALALKATGVRIYAVGVGDIEDELNNLASEASTVARAGTFVELSELNEQILETLDDEVKGIKLCTGMSQEPSKTCSLEVLVGFDVSSQNIFQAQRILESKMGAILQRITKMTGISCSSGQIPLIQVGILALDAASEPVHLEFTDNADTLFEAFRALRTRGPYLLNTKTIAAYSFRFKSRATDAVKVVIHLTDGLDGQYNEMKRQVEELKISGVNSFILVGLERVPRFEEAVLLEFGRGFRYTRPLRVNVMDLDYELLEELDNIAERECCAVPCKCTGTRGDRGAVGLGGLKAELVEQAIPEMRVDPETEVLLVSTELKVSRAVLDRGASRVVVGTLEKRVNLERLAWMASMEKRARVESLDHQETEETLGEGDPKELKDMQETSGTPESQEILEPQGKITTWLDLKETQAMSAQ
ncbi:unnamed protein product, partial [Coregonus sp. 'balchen']